MRPRLFRALATLGTLERPFALSGKLLTLVHVVGHAMSGLPLKADDSARAATMPRTRNRFLFDLPFLAMRVATPVHKDKNNVIAATLTRLTNKADTSGRITKALGEGP